MERGGSDLTGGLVCYQIYETQDQKHLTLAALEPQFWTAFCQTAGREDLLEAHMAPAIRGELAYEALCALFRERTRDEWEVLFAEVDACCEPVLSVGEVLASPPGRALNMLVGEGLLPPVRLSAHPDLSLGPAPSLGEHTAALLEELGYGLAEVESLRESGVV